MATVKMVTYKLTLEDGQEVDYEFENGLLFRNEETVKTPTLILNAVLTQSYDKEVEDAPVEVHPLKPSKKSSFKRKKK